MVRVCRPSRQPWAAGRSLPASRWREPGPEGAAREGHLDQQSAGPPRGGPRPSARRSRLALPPAASGCPDSPPPQPARRRRARPALPAADRPGPGGPLPLPPSGRSPGPRPSPGPPRHLLPSHTPGSRSAAQAEPRPVPPAPTSREVQRARRRLPRGLQRESQQAAVPGAGRRGGRRRGPAPILRAPPTSSAPWVRPGHRPVLRGVRLCRAGSRSPSRAPQAP